LGLETGYDQLCQAEEVAAFGLFQPNAGVFFFLFIIGLNKKIQIKTFMNPLE
jgi:hypothetical protein